MKIAIGGIFTESNQFSLNPITMNEFKRGGIIAGSEFYQAKIPSIRGCIEGLNEENAEIVPLLYASASPGGKVTLDAFEELYSDLMARLQKNKDLDGLILNMHGAAILEDGAHLDSIFLERIRERLCDTPVFITVDLHAYITEKLVKSSDVIIAWNTYPHRDMFDIGKKTAKLLSRTIRGEITPKMVFSGVNVITSAINASTEGSGPFAKLMTKQLNVESAQEDILSSSLFLCQPYLNQPRMMSGSIIISNNSLQKAKRLSYEFAQSYWHNRWNLLSESKSANQVLNTIDCEEYDHHILVEASDCCGGGAVGDSIHTIRQLIRLNSDQKSLSIVVDTKAIDKLSDKKIGANIKLKIGHQSDPKWGTPIEENFEIINKSSGKFIYQGGIWEGETGDMGLSYLLKKSENYILVNSKPTYEWAGEQYLAMNLDLNDYKFILVKNPMNYRNLKLLGSTQYHKIDEPGPTPIKIEELSFTKNKGFFPKNLDEKMVIRQYY
jgi:microcystin degradation protein MlrC